MTTDQQSTIDGSGNSRQGYSCEGKGCDGSEWGIPLLRGPMQRQKIWWQWHSGGRQQTTVVAAVRQQSTKSDSGKQWRWLPRRWWPATAANGNWQQDTNNKGNCCHASYPLVVVISWKRQAGSGSSCQRVTKSGPEVSSCCRKSAQTLSHHPQQPSLSS
jgi:hypothetical protein